MATHGLFCQCVLHSLMIIAPPSLSIGIPACPAMQELLSWEMAIQHLFQLAWKRGFECDGYDDGADKVRTLPGRQRLNSSTKLG